MRWAASLGVLLAVCGAGARAQGYQDEVSREEYLAMLERILPAAREAAELYARSFSERCGRMLATAELRRAFADGNGDPVLMGMVRAQVQGDGRALRSLAASVKCAGKRNAG